MTARPGIGWLDLGVVLPRPPDGHGAGHGSTVHLHLPDYLPPGSRRKRSMDAPLCGQFAFTDDRVPLAAAFTTWEDHWRWCRCCIGHAADLLNAQGVITQLVLDRQRLEAEAAELAERSMS